MRKMGKVLLFLSVLGLGIIIIDNIVLGLPGPSCHCYDFAVLEDECAYSCGGEGFCDHFMVWLPGFCRDEYLCCTPVTLYSSYKLLRIFSSDAWV